MLKVSSGLHAVLNLTQDTDEYLKRKIFEAIILRVLVSCINAVYISEVSINCPCSHLLNGRLLRAHYPQSFSPVTLHTSLENHVVLINVDLIIRTIFVRTMKFLLTVFTVFYCSLPTCEAYPFGAGGCAGGEAAVGAPHRIVANVTTGTIESGGFMVTLDSNPLTMGTPADFIAGEPHTLQIVALGSNIFRGFLFRLAGGPTGVAPMFNLAPLFGDTTAQYSIVCINDFAGGVTHTSNVTKTIASANLTFPIVGNGLNLDISIVVQNRYGVSIFYYSGYVLNSISAVPTPPIPAPTLFPVAPVMAPIRNPRRRSKAPAKPRKG